eukprot:TRINITY_DN2693_c0_g1_i2.p1 TRINITY_DN2693_c0_g1~~TRINITY_DN2693_c0_g1_i2.p1  ORF type:complete len:326 (+),score=124.50 TRINITY_DN2693_c0_g1_i2:81-1058(+)
MSGVKNHITECIGNTPLVRLHAVTGENCVAKDVLLKLESENPGKSVKDRVALGLIQYYEEQGKLVRGVSTIVEATSGNTGIGLAMVGAALGYKVIIVMPDSCSLERRVLLRAYGAELKLTKGIELAIKLAGKIVSEDPNAVRVDQFSCPANPETHMRTTGPEIFRDTDGAVDVLVTGPGTGGTITGTGKYLKQQKPSVKVVCVEPKDSPFLSTGCASTHRIMGIGAPFKPAVLDTSVYDEIRLADADESFDMSRALAQKEGILAGMSGGAIVSVAVKLAQEAEYKDKTIVAIVPSYGERYLSTELYAKVKEEALQLPVCSEEECS